MTMVDRHGAPAGWGQMPAPHSAPAGPFTPAPALLIAIDVLTRLLRTHAHGGAARGRGPDNRLAAEALHVVEVLDRAHNWSKMSCA